MWHAPAVLHDITNGLFDSRQKKFWYVARGEQMMWESDGFSDISWTMSVGGDGAGDDESLVTSTQSDTVLSDFSYSNVDYCFRFMVPCISNENNE
jgi:hypothetical protein